MGSGEAFTLEFDARPRVAGHKITGAVVLNVRRALDDKIERIRVRLRGSALAQIMIAKGTAITYHRSITPLVVEDAILWTDAPSKEHGSGVVRLPFEFTLPTNLPPAFHASAILSYTTTISYGVQVVADRHGLLRFKQRIGRTFPVFPLATSVQGENASRISRGWNGPWKTSEKTELIRKKMWGDHAKVEGQLCMPDVDSFPIGLPIPISFTITTHTKPIEKDKKSRKDELDFPAPPKTPEDVKFLLLQHVKLKVKLYGGTIDLKHGSVGGFGKAGDKSASIAAAPTKTSVLEPTWIPEAGHGKLGRWRQETRFDTTLMFNCAPNISLEPSIRMLTELRIEVPFGGIGNDLEWKIPVELNSGVASLDPNVRLPPLWELHKDYFTGDLHDWDEKDYLEGPKAATDALVAGVGVVQTLTSL